MRVGVSLGTTTDVAALSDQIKRYRLRDLPEPSSAQDALNRMAGAGSAQQKPTTGGDMLFNGHKATHHDHTVNPGKEPLRDKCLKVIVANFARLPVTEGACSPELMRMITGHLPLDLDPAMGALHVFDESYWKRRCIDRLGWSQCDLMGHGQIWKQLFFETYLQETLEDFGLPPGEERHPDHLTTVHHHIMGGPRVKDTRTEKQKLFEKLEAGQDNVFSLTIKELMSHLPAESFLSRLPNLAKLSLTYSVRKTGMARLRMDFGMTEADASGMAACLADAPRCCPSLTTLSLPGNLLDDDLVRVLMEGLVRNDTVTSLDLSHNKISNGGARLLSKLLGEESVLTSLNLADNAIRSEGGRYLGRGLRANDSLVELNLRLNRLGDEGGRMLLEGVRSCGHGSGLARLNLAGNSLGAGAAKALGDIFAADFGAGGSGAGGATAGPSGVLSSKRSQAQTQRSAGLASPSRSSAPEGGRGPGNGTGLLGGGSGLVAVDLSSNGLEASEVGLLERRLANNRSLISLDLRGNPAHAAPEAADALAAIAKLTRQNELAAR